MVGVDAVLVSRIAIGLDTPISWIASVVVIDRFG